MDTVPHTFKNIRAGIKFHAGYDVPEHSFQNAILMSAKLAKSEKLTGLSAKWQDSGLASKAIMSTLAEFGYKIQEPLYKTIESLLPNNSQTKFETLILSLIMFGFDQSKINAYSAICEVLADSTQAISNLPIEDFIKLQNDGFYQDLSDYLSESMNLLNSPSTSISLE